LLGVVLGLLAGFTYGAADFIGGLASRRSSAVSVVVISQVAGLLALLLLVGLLPKSAPTVADIGWGSAAGLAGAAGITFLYRGLAIGRMSLVSPVTAVIAAMIPFVWGLVFGERPSLLAVAGVALALIAVILVSVSEHPGDPVSNAAPGLVGILPAVPARASTTALNLPPGLVEAVISGLGVGAFYVLLARTGPNAGLWPLAGSRSASIAVLLVFAAAGRRTLAPAQGAYPAIVLSGVIDMLANAFYLLATRHGLLALVAVLASLYPASTVLLARVILKERLTLVQLGGVACALAAVAGIAAGQNSH
jgi:drug/metabolite transporter (DMT)-like permease